MPIAVWDHAVFLRADASVAVPGLSWSWRRGEHWAVVGGTGCGKTSVLEALTGRHRLVSGHAAWHLDRPPTLVGFRRAAGYHQQRYDLADSEEPQSVQEYLSGAPLPLFKLESQLSQPFMTLSNGQMRKARLAKSLLQQPAALLLDDPFAGLDVEARCDLAALLPQLPMPLLLACRPEDVPPWVTHRMELGEVAATMPSTIPPLISPGEPIIELTDITVKHGGRVILERVSWTVRRGERWSLTGPNGAGKTTLLALVVGDHPQAFSNDVRVFGARRGSGETVWDIRRRVGFVSPEFHLYFAEDLSAAEAAETGFTDTLLHTIGSDEQRAAVRSLFEELGFAELADRRMRRLSTGQQRLALLVRALVKRPPLLVLDEPYQGLDASLIAKFNDWLARNLTAEQTLIVTTHRPAELPAAIDRHFKLSAGREVSCTLPRN